MSLAAGLSAFTMSLANGQSALAMSLNYHWANGLYHVPSHWSIVPYHVPCCWSIGPCHVWSIGPCHNYHWAIGPYHVPCRRLPVIRCMKNRNVLFRINSSDYACKARMFPSAEHIYHLILTQSKPKALASYVTHLSCFQLPHLSFCFSENRLGIAIKTVWMGTFSLVSLAFPESAS